MLLIPSGKTVPCLKRGPNQRRSVLRIVGQGITSRCIWITPSSRALRFARRWDAARSRNTYGHFAVHRKRVRTRQCPFLDEQRKTCAPYERETVDLTQEEPRPGPRGPATLPHGEPAARRPAAKITSRAT